MLIVKNCSSYGENVVFDNNEDLREWHEEQHYPFIRVINTDKHLTLSKTTNIEHVKSFMRVRSKSSPTGYVTIPSEHIVVDGKKFTVNQFFKEYQNVNEEPED